jgi:histidine triad (HIT) family protein
MSPHPRGCAFCALLADPAQGHFIYHDDLIAAFLDRNPLFPGHCLVIPCQHYETLADLPPDLLTPLFGLAQQLSAIIPPTLGAEGSLLINNNRISQSVPRLHLHVIPRRRGDGQRHFMWPRQPYSSAQQAVEIARQLSEALAACRCQTGD